MPLESKQIFRRDLPAAVVLPSQVGIIRIDDAQWRNQNPLITVRFETGPGLEGTESVGPSFRSRARRSP
jgi:hypothetical protein